jgi:hypothetical protein
MGGHTRIESVDGEEKVWRRSAGLIYCLRKPRTHGNNLGSCVKGSYTKATPSNNGDGMFRTTKMTTVQTLVPKQ